MFNTTSQLHWNWGCTRLVCVLVCAITKDPQCTVVNMVQALNNCAGKSRQHALSVGAKMVW